VGVYAGPDIVENGLVLALDAGNSKSYPGSGETWTDLSGNGNNLTAINPSSISWYSSGYFSTGTTGYFSGSGTASIPIGNSNYTMMAWVRFPSSWGSRRGIISIGGFGSPGVSNALRTTDNGNVGNFLHWWYSYDLTVSNNNAGLSAGTWFMITAQFDGTNRRVWANTTNVGSDTPGNVHNVQTTAILVGNGPDPNSLFQGDIAQVSIYNRALSAAEIQQNYLATKSRYFNIPVASSSIITTGLQLYLDAGVSSSYPGSGTTWTDLSGNTNDGTLTNGPTYSSADGGSIVFDGIDDYVALPSGPADAFYQADWTINFWVKLDRISSQNNGSDDNTFLQHGSNTTRKGLHLVNRNSRLHFGLYVDDLQATSVLSVSTWYNVSFTLNNTSYAKQIYLNGILDSSHTGGGAYTGTGSNARIGGIALGFGSHFDGFMSNCTFYNRILTATEIQQNFNATKSRFGLGL
jgi:hypothetical protein